MRVPSYKLEEIKDRLVLSQIMGRRLQWDRKKSRPAKGDFWACCFSHSEKTPSLHVEDRKGRFFCFGCGVSGDAFTYLTLTGRSFSEAVTELAEEARVEITPATPEERVKTARRLSLVEANDAACDLFQASLTQEVRQYLAGRGITQEEIEHFRIGFAPQSWQLDVSRETLVEAGLYGEDDGRTYPRFRSRVMFPVLDARGKAIAFTGRAFGNVEPKYLNSPATSIFDKSRTLYNGPEAKKAAHESDAKVVLVEGAMDTIASRRGGYPASCAPMGTALTEEQVQMVWRMSAEPVMCFDGDAAGIKAAYRAVDLYLPLIGPGFSARFAILPPKMDPDKLVTERGPDAYRRLIESPLPLSDILWRRETVGRDVSTPEHRAAVEGRLMECVGKINDRSTRDEYRREFRDRLHSLNRRPKVFRSNSNHSTSPAAIRLTENYRRPSFSLREATLIAAISLAPDIAVDRAEALPADERLSATAREIVSKMVDAAVMDGGSLPVGSPLRAVGLSGAISDALEAVRAAGVPMTRERAVSVLSSR